MFCVLHSTRHGHLQSTLNTCSRIRIYIYDGVHCSGTEKGRENWKVIQKRYALVYRIEYKDTVYVYFKVIVTNWSLSWHWRLLPCYNMRQVKLWGNKQWTCWFIYFGIPVEWRNMDASQHDNKKILLLIVTCDNIVVNFSFESWTGMSDKTFFLNLCPSYYIRGLAT